MCKKNRIRRYSKLRKAQLIEILTKMYVHHVVSSLILNRYKKNKKNTEIQPKILQTCDICNEDTICIKICRCSSKVCMQCIEHMKNPETCCVCRSSTEQYLRSLKTGWTDLQVQALFCILDRKTTPTPTPTIPPPIMTCTCKTATW